MNVGFLRVILLFGQGKKIFECPLAGLEFYLSDDSESSDE